MQDKRSSALLGIDMGTTQCKAILIDTSGDVLSFATQEYPTLRPFSGWALQRPEDWWEAIKNTIKRVLSEAGPRKVLAIGAAGTQEGIVPVDSEGNKLHDCMTWEDWQSATQNEWIRETIGDDLLLRITGTTSSFAGSAPRALHLKLNFPVEYNSTYKFLSAKDYINLRLCGEFATDWTNASHTQLLDLRTRHWSDELFDKMSLSIEKWPDVHAPTDIIGKVTPTAAEETGLAKGTPVIAGGGDQEACAIGSRSVQVGNVYEVVGTTDMLCATVSKPVYDERVQCFCHPEFGKWIVTWYAGLTGGILRWYRDNLGDTETETARRLAISPYQIMDLEAEQAKDTGLIFMQRFGGELGTSILYNLSFSVTKKEIIKAMFEGSAFELRYFFDEPNKAFVENVKQIVLSGGVSRSRLWRQVRADITGIKFLLPRVVDTTAYGTALLAGVAAGVFKSIAEAADVVAIEETIILNPESSAKYSSLYEDYKNLRRSASVINQGDSL